MPAFSLVLLISATITYGAFIGNLNNQIGHSCASADTIEITSFDINPYPPCAGESSNITIIGHAAHTIDIGQIINSIENQYQEWTYQYQTINHTYFIYSAFNFEYPIEWPKLSGNYLAEVTIHERTSQNIIVACWVFVFSL